MSDYWLLKERARNFVTSSGFSWLWCHNCRGWKSSQISPYVSRVESGINTETLNPYDWKCIHSRQTSRQDCTCVGDTNALHHAYSHQQVKTDQSLALKALKCYAPNLLLTLGILQEKNEDNPGNSRIHTCKRVGNVCLNPTFLPRQCREKYGINTENKAVGNFCVKPRFLTTHLGEMWD